MPLPPELYHATAKGNAESIKQQGLLPYSVTEGKPNYLCMSGVETGARTKTSQASDVIFRVASSTLNATQWVQEGAGAEEWRSTYRIPPTHLWYRRNLGTPEQLTWRPVSSYPLGM